MAREQTTLVLGRGEVFFDLFRPGTRQGDGERYIGNSSTFQIGRKLERLDRFTSYNGRKIEQESAIISETHTVTFVTDNIVIENIGLWYGLESEVVVTVAANAITEFFPVRLGRTYQLGKSYMPLGVRYVENVVVRIDDVIVPLDGNYALSAATGRLEVSPDAINISDGQTLEITFEWRTTEAARTNSAARDVYGALRFISFNAYGPDKQYYFPFVRLSPRGMMDLKGDDWQQAGFDVEARNLNPRTEQVYVEEFLKVYLTADEQAIVDLSGLTLDSFPYWENQLDQLVNVTMPSHNYPG